MKGGTEKSGSHSFLQLTAGLVEMTDMTSAGIFISHPAWLISEHQCGTKSARRSKRLGTRYGNSRWFAMEPQSFLLQDDVLC